MRGDRIVAAILAREGTQEILGFPHSELFEAGAEIGIRPIIARSQRVAVNIAEGLARTAVGDRPAVITTQYGPGVESAFGAVAQAYNDCARVLFIPTGYPRGRDAVAPNFQACRNFRSITKWCEAAARIEDLPQLMHTAFARLRNGAPGPVLLELPVDLLAEDLDWSPADYYSPARIRPKAGDEELAAIIDALDSAKRPLIWAGQGVLDAQASDELRYLAERLGAPVITSPNGKSAFPEDHPLALGTGGRSRPDTVDHFLAKADLVLAVGSSLTRSDYIAEIPAKKTIVQITIDDADIGKDYEIAVGAVGCARAILGQINGVFDARGRSGAIDYHTTASEIATIKSNFLADWQPSLDAAGSPVSPYRIVGELIKTLDRTRTVITHDAGYPRDQLCPFFESVVPQSYIGWGKTTQLGSSLGFALGARLARPDWISVALMGEAAFGMVGLDFETAVRCCMPILVVVMRNELMTGYATLMPIAAERYGAHRLSGRYAPIAEALGGYAESVASAEDLPAALGRCLAAVEGGRAALLEVETVEDSRLAGRAAR